MMICKFCQKHEIRRCKYNYSRQNCCGADECVQKRRKGYQAKMDEKGYWKQPGVRTRSNETRRAQRRAEAYPMLALVLKAVAEEVERIIESTLEASGEACERVVNRVVRSIRGAVGIAV